VAPVSMSYTTSHQSATVSTGLSCTTVELSDFENILTWNVV